MLWFESSSSAFVEAYGDAIEKEIQMPFRTEVVDHGNIKDVIQVNLASGKGPDGFDLMSGPGFAGPLIRARLLANLDTYYEEYGWNERFLPWAIEEQVTDGHKYGLPGSLDMIGIFYYKDIFAKLGLSVPQTYEELQNICQILKDNGYIPLAFANQGKWPAYHIFSMYANNIAGHEKLDQMLLGEHSWQDPDIIVAIQNAFVDMLPYYPVGVNGISYDDGNLLFYNQNAGMLPTGSWLLKEIRENVLDPSNVGFFPMPAPSGKVTVPPSGLGGAYYISEFSKYKNQVAHIFDIMHRESTVPFWSLEVNRIPSFKVKDIIAMFSDNQVLDRDVYSVLFNGQFEIGYNIDVRTPAEFNQVMSDGFQAVMAGERSAAEMAEALQQAWESAKK